MKKIYSSVIPIFLTITLTIAPCIFAETNIAPKVKSDREIKDLSPTYEIISREKPDTKKEATPAKKAPLSDNLTKLEKEILADTRQAENLFYRSGALYEDDKVTDYLNGIANRLVDSDKLDETMDLKIRIIREPTVNAFAMATGSIYIHTGALARLESEDQLAHLLGHEISHVVNKDMLYFVESYHKKIIVYKIFDIVLAPTSVFFGLLGDLAQSAFLLFHVATVTGYSRLDEARADKEGMQCATRQGYGSQGGTGLMQVFLKEGERYQSGPEIFFLMMHPTTKWRLNELNRVTSEKAAVPVVLKPDSDAFLQNMAKIKLYNATLNIKWDRLEHAKDNIQWVLEKVPDNPEAHYLAGEIYRLEAEDKKKVKEELNYAKWSELNKGYKKTELEEAWCKKAQEEYGRAIVCDGAYANSYKGLALLCKYKDKREEAVVNLKKYLAAAPEASDKRYVNNLIEKLNRQAKGA